ncbi:MAG: septum site-determining protein MinC [Clostridiales bacterium]|jgi:septum site-determining protein MinC|nr:septum site-determining protein MinC [Clostridiales bacterium]
MQDENLVVFKGAKNGINVWLDEQADFNALKKTLRLKTLEAKNFFEDAEAAITFSGRNIDKSEESELLNIIFSESNLNISIVEVEPAEDPEEPRAHRMGLAPAVALDKNEQLTFFYEGALRNGQSIRYDGSVVVLGDANPGSEIIAKGSVIVLGALKGLVHAGCTGDASSYICALRMTPTQLRICDIITYIPEEKKSKNKNTPSYAYIQEGLIYIAPLLNG